MSATNILRIRECGHCLRMLPDGAFFRGMTTCKACRRAEHASPPGRVSSLRIQDLLRRPDLDRLSHPCPPPAHGECQLGTCHGDVYVRVEYDASGVTVSVTTDAVCWEHRFYFTESAAARDLCPECGRRMVAMGEMERGHCIACELGVSYVVTPPSDAWWTTGVSGMSA